MATIEVLELVRQSKQNERNAEPFAGSAATLCGAPHHRDGGSCVERSPSVLSTDAHLAGTPAPLVNEERSASFLGPPTDASCSCELLPSCSQTLLSEGRRCCKVGTPAEFKWGRPEWSNRWLAGTRVWFPWFYS